MKIGQRENLIRRYLLGALSEANQTAFEQELLADRGKFDHVWAVENELIDSYVRGKMSGADRERFEGHYLASPLHRERVATAEAFLTNIDQTVGGAIEIGEKDPVVPWRSRVSDLLHWPRPVLGGTMVLAFLLTVGGAWSYLERVRLTGQIAKLQNETLSEHASLKQREQELASRNQELEREIAVERQRREELKAELERLRRQPPSSSSAVLSFLLTPAAPVRSEKAPPQSMIPLFVGKACLLMELNGEDYANYQVILQTVEGREILQRRTGKVMFGKARAFVTLPVKAGELTRGDYILILFGQTTDGRSEEIDRYFFRVS